MCGYNVHGDTTNLHNSSTCSGGGGSECGGEGEREGFRSTALHFHDSAGFHISLLRVSSYIVATHMCNRVSIGNHARVQPCLHWEPRTCATVSPLGTTHVCNRVSIGNHARVQPCLHWEPRTCATVSPLGTTHVCNRVSIGNHARVQPCLHWEPRTCATVSPLGTTHMCNVSPLGTTHMCNRVFIGNHAHVQPCLHWEPRTCLHWEPRTCVTVSPLGTTHMCNSVSIGNHARTCATMSPLFSRHYRSIFGGQVLSFSGSGFGSDSSQIGVSFGGRPCDVVRVVDEEILCVTSPASSTHYVNNNA